MSKTVNILGDSPKQQWMNAVGIFELCICENVRSVLETMDGLCDRTYRPDSDECTECNRCHSLEVTVKAGHDFADEMRRLVEGVFE